MHNHHICFRAGFTLTELMAVVIVIGILSAIGAGSYKKAVERSRLSDGLMAATTVMESVNRYYLENQLSANVACPSAQQLDIDFPKQGTCNSRVAECIKTKFFETTVCGCRYGNLTQGYVDARRVKEGESGDYAIRVYSSVFGANRNKPEACVYFTTGGRDLCISAGYTNCSGTVATKECMEDTAMCTK